MLEILNMSAEMLSANVEFDEELYQKICKCFVADFLRRSIQGLQDYGCIQIRANCEIREADLNKIFEIEFDALARFEDFGGFECDGQKFHAACVFSSDVPGRAFVGSRSRVALHGSVYDELIQSAHSEVCAARAGAKALLAEGDG